MAAMKLEQERKLEYNQIRVYTERKAKNAEFRLKPVRTVDTWID